MFGGQRSAATGWKRRLPRTSCLIRRFSFRIFAFASAFSVSAALVQAESPLAAPIDGESFPAQVMAISKGQVEFLTGQQRRAIPLTDLVLWGQCTEPSRGVWVVLNDGGLLVSNSMEIDQDRLDVDSPALGTKKLPLDRLAGIVFHPPGNRDDCDLLLDRLLRATGESDRLLLDNGDELNGLMGRIQKDTAQRTTDSGRVDLKTDRIQALIFNPALRRKPVDSRSSIWLGFADGSRLLAANVKIEENVLAFSAGGENWNTSPQELVFLQTLQGRAVYLSDLQPSEYRQTPFLDLSWPLQRDRNATGGLLRSGGRLYLKGLGVHSVARITYLLDQPYRTFKTELGIDDSTTGQGSAIFRVLVDGQEKYSSKVVRGGDRPTSISVDVQRAKKIELLVDYADRADVLDRADWLNARFEK